MSKIIHIIKDEKFVDGVIFNYEKIFPEGSIYLIIVDGTEKGLKYTTPHSAIEVVDYREVDSCIEKFLTSQTFIFHGLDRVRLKILKKIPVHKKVVVHFWGADIYLLPYFKGKLLKTETRRIYKKATSLTRRIVDYLRGYYFHYLYRKYLGKVSYYSTVIPTESNYISRYLTNAEQIGFNYVDIEMLKLEGKNISSKAHGILIGNSSSYTGNHVDIIKRIASDPKLAQVKKVLPLNYGDKKYADEVGLFIRQNEFLGFETITEFLPINEYLEILLGCSVAIMYHQRQQAVGSILMCIWLGMKVFLSETNPVYSYFKDLGIEVFSYEKEIDHLGRHIKEVLSGDVVEKNRKVLKSIYSKETTLNQAKKLLEMVHGKY
jgi:hypothetical protein